MDVNLIETTFSKIAPKKSEFADTFYDTLFERYPAVKPLFQSTDWPKQKSMLVAALTTVVNNARDPTTIIGTLKKMGARHLAYGAKEEHFPAVGECLLHALKVHLDENWNESVEQSWIEAYGLVSGVMIEGLNAEKA